MFQSSFPSGSNSTELGTRACFVDNAVKAYSGQYHLVIRPDDVWVAILTQFNLYVNANAEKLRHLFVAHQGKQELVIKQILENRYKVDVTGRLAEEMGMLIEESVVDPGLREWFIPEFSPTTKDDIMASIIMMGTLKSYFSYTYSLVCGLPAVTLLGEKADWEKILLKAEKLRSYGKQTTQWHSLLKPVLAAFVRSFDEPDSDRTKDFWQRIAHHERKSCESGLSGWITAFCFFDDKGRPLYNEDILELVRTRSRTDYLVLDGVGYHHVKTSDIPSAHMEVHVELDDLDQ